MGLEQGSVPVEAQTFRAPKPIMFERVTAEALGQTSIGVATLDDVWEISALISTNFLHHPAYSDTDWRVRSSYLRSNSPDELFDTLQRPGTHTYVLRSDIGIAAVMISRETPPEDVKARFVGTSIAVNGVRPVPSALDIRRLHARLDVDRLGLGTQLITHAEQEARRMGLTALISDAALPAQSYFERKGYTGETIEIGRQNGSHSHIFRCIKFLEGE
jgi:GNAT superfamily N-acetyltransferase